MKILILNCGSTNIKFKLFDKKTLSVLCEGLVDRIDKDDSSITISNQEGKTKKLEVEIKDYRTGIHHILRLLEDSDVDVLKSLSEIKAVGHRIAAGGVQFKESVLITPAVIDGIRKATVLAPLHNPANIEGILGVQSLLPDVQQVAVFDTAFHQSLPMHAYIYGLPYEMYEDGGIRKYGFHGASHQYVSQRGCQILNLAYNKQRIIVAHLGGGSSVCAIKDGKSIDTSLGMTSLGGVMMGTRCGDIDPGLVPFIMAEKELTVDEMSNIMYTKSGLLGISGVSQDMRDVEKEANGGNGRAKLAMDIFAYQIKKQVGSFVAVLGGLDMLIFTGGIGENHAYTREKACAEMEYLGLELDVAKNDLVHGEESIVSTVNSKAKILVIPTNEELLIAQDTAKLVY